MNRPPRPPLDADEQALATELPRLRGRDQPGAALDARILGSAHAAVAAGGPARASTRPPRQRRWLLPASVAATIAIAGGLAWQLRPLPVDKPRVTAPASAPAPAADGAMRVRMIERPAIAPPPPPPPAIVAAPTRGAASPPPPATAPATTPARPVLEHFHDEAAATLATDATDAETAVAAPAAPSPAAVPRAKTAMREAVPAARNEAEQAAGIAPADSTSAADSADAAGAPPSTHLSDIAGEDVPPATMDSPQAREAWLARIRDLLRAGEVDAAKASLQEFRHRHPDASLPPELQQLEP